MLPELLALDPWPTPLLEPPMAPDELAPEPPELVVLPWPPLLLDPDEPPFPDELPDPEELEAPLPPLLPPAVASSFVALSPSSEGDGNSVVPPYGPPNGSPALLQPVAPPSARATVKLKRNFKLRGMTCSAAVPRFGAYHFAVAESTDTCAFIVGVGNAHTFLFNETIILNQPGR